MLERAGPCFKAGARDSLRCATATAHHGTQKMIGKVPHSQRQLHQHFWKHGAGDLGLPPFAIPAIPPRDLPLRHDSTSEAKTRTRAPPRDGIFLDFLYPPQALAWLNGVNAHHREPWERRNARRLPEGFIQASRGYSSRSHVRMTEVKTPEQLGVSEDSAPGKNHVQADYLDDLEHTAYDHNPGIDNAGTIRIDNAEMSHSQEETTEPAPDTHGEADTSFISAGDLAEAGELTRSGEEGIAQLEGASVMMDADIVVNPYTVGSDDPQQRLLGLRRILNTNPRHARLESVPRTWGLFLSLDGDEKDDVRLKEKLLSWLVETDHEHVPAYSITLLWSIPKDKRTLQLYQLAARPLLPPAQLAASTSPMRLTRIDNFEAIKQFKLDHPSNQLQSPASISTQQLAETLHDEAVSHLANVSQLSFMMFSAAMQGQSWHQALRFFEASALQASTQQHELFLLKISEIPNILQAVNHLRWHLKPMSETERARWLPMWVNSAKEAIELSFQPRIPDDFMNRRTVLYANLFFLSLWGPEHVDFFRGLLAHRLKIVDEYVESPKLLKIDTWSLAIISRVYKYFRELPGAKLDEDLLLILLRLRCNSLVSTIKRADADTQDNVSLGLLANDWQRWHTKIGLDGVRALLAFAAEAGDVGTVASWSAYLERNYPKYQDYKSTFWARIHVHALAGDVGSARSAFDEVQAVLNSHGDKLYAECWRSLIKAHERVADLEGAFSTLQSAIRDGCVNLPSESFEGVMRMLSHCGEVKAVNDLVKQYKRLSGDSRTRNWHLTSQIKALCGADRSHEAEEMLREAHGNSKRPQDARGDILEEAPGDVTKETHGYSSQGEFVGSFTTCCNALLSCYLRNRDIEATTQIYRWMKIEKIKLNGASYRYLLTILAEFRQAAAAWVILKTVMQAEGCPPDASHYGAVMYGYIRTGELEKVHIVYKRMLKKNIRPSLDVEKLVIKASLVADKRRQNMRIRRGETDAPSLASTRRKLQTMVKFISGRNLAVTPHKHGSSVTDKAADLFASVISEYANQGHFEEAKQLFEQSKEFSVKLGLVEWPTLRLHTSWMRALLRAKEYEQVEKYWRVVKNQGDRLAHTSVSEVRSSQHQGRTDYRPNEPIIEPASSDSRAELGFSNDNEPVQTVTEEYSTGRKDISRLGPRPSLGRRHLLTNPFQVYMNALMEQGRVADMVREFTNLVTQGYEFHNVLWNRFIEYLCVSADPPLALLAFTLTERYLMPNFPGWRTGGWSGADGRIVKPSSKVERTEGMHYMKRHYFSYLQLVPKYRTMLNLARALVDIRRLEAAGIWSAEHTPGSMDQKLKRFVGSVKQIQEKAPKTVAAVTAMPRVEEKWQSRILRDQGWEASGGNPRRRNDNVEASVMLSLPPLAEDADSALDALRKDANGPSILDSGTDVNGYAPFGGTLKADGDEATVDGPGHDTGVQGEQWG